MGRHYSQYISFMRTTEWNFGTITITPRMLRVLSCIKGVTSIEKVKPQLSMSFEELCSEIYNLLHLNLIAIADTGRRENTSGTGVTKGRYCPPSIPRQLAAEA